MKAPALFLTLIFFWSCDPEVEQVPSNIINQSKMVYIMMDIHIIDAAVNFNNDNPRGLFLNKQELYKEVYKKHKVRKSQFDSSFTYYATHVEKMQEIYDDLLIRLSEKQAAVNSSQPSPI